jgi:enamine deaminase RidA (YjgF/YER057c/UK114 family)
VPVAEDEVAGFRIKLQNVPTILNQAETNLTDAVGELTDLTLFHLQNFDGTGQREGNCRRKGQMSPKRRWIGSGVKSEELFGYARAVRVGDRILVSATSASGPDGVVARGDAGGQTRHILQKIEEAVRQLGGTLADVVFTRVYLRNKDDLMAVAPVHAEYFGDIRPASTLVLAGFVDDDFLLEMEAEAVIGSG